MNTEKKLSKKDISERIVAGMGMVYGLFNEMHAFFRLFVETMHSSDLDIALLKSKFGLPHAKKRRFRDAADDYVKTEMGVIAEIGAGGPEEEENEESEEEIEAEFEKKGLSIVSTSKFLAVRASLYDPKRVKEGPFEPYVVGAVLCEITAYPRGKTLKKAGTTAEKMSDFNIKKRREFFRLMRQLEPGLKKDQEISWKVTKYTVSAKVKGIVSRPLVDFDTEKKFNEFSEKLLFLARNG